MKFGLAVSGTTEIPLLEKMAIVADELGYDSFLITDHFMGPRGNNHMDAWSFIPYIAAKTEKIRLGTCVTPLPFRPPALLAKMVATSDNLSNGRVILGAGAGWYKPEFEAFSKWFENSDRVTITKESLELMTRLWSSDGPVSYHGKFVSAEGALVSPKPIQKPYSPIWFGSLSERTLKLAGRFGSGWIPVGPRWIGNDYPTPEKYSSMRNIIVNELKKNNKNESEFVFSSLINIAEIEQLRRDIDSYVSVGLNYFILGMARETDESFVIANIERVKTDLAASL